MGWFHFFLLSGGFCSRTGGGASGDATSGPARPSGNPALGGHQATGKCEGWRDSAEEVPFLGPRQALAQHLHQNLFFTPHRLPLTPKTNPTFHTSAPAQSSGIFSPVSDTSLKMYSEPRFSPQRCAEQPPWPRA